jgi:hypothetical protein
MSNRRFMRLKESLFVKIVVPNIKVIKEIKIVFITEVAL